MGTSFARLDVRRLRRRSSDLHRHICNPKNFSATETRTHSNPGRSWRMWQLFRTRASITPAPPCRHMTTASSASIIINTMGLHRGAAGQRAAGSYVAANDVLCAATLRRSHHRLTSPGRQLPEAGHELARHASGRAERRVASTQGFGGPRRKSSGYAARLRRCDGEGSTVPGGCRGPRIVSV